MITGSRASGKSFHHSALVEAELLDVGPPVNFLSVAPISPLARYDNWDRWRSGDWVLS
jgi:hypothetical protein